MSEILADAADRSNSPAFAVNTRITLSRATYWLAQAVRNLCALLRQAHQKDREFLQFATVPTLAGFPLISLPPDCGEVHAVIWHRDERDYALLKSASQDDLARVPLDIGRGWDAAGETPRWRLEGQTIAFYPTSGIAETVDVYYTTQLSATSGTFQARVGFDEWVTLDVLIKIATSKKQFADAREFQQQKALLEDDLLAPSRQRDVNETHTIRDVRGCRGRR